MLAGDVSALTTQVQQLTDRIRGALGPLGVTDEADLRSFVTNRFPTLFLVGQVRSIVDLLSGGVPGPARIGTYLGGRFSDQHQHPRYQGEHRQRAAENVDLRNIVDMTAQDLHVTGNPVLESAVQSRISNEQSEEADVQIALTALTITAVGLAAGAYNASESVRNYLANSAASNTGGRIALELAA
jgi:hypothetical protein